MSIQNYNADELLHLKWLSIKRNVKYFRYF